jgi:oligopeptide transport system substrate-binding protein
LVEKLELGELLTSPVFANYYYQFNTSSQPLRDKRVRRSLSMALNREALVDEILQGGQKPARGLMPHNTMNFIPDNNQKEARNLLVEAGYSDVTDIPELEMIVENEESHLYLAEYLQAQWKKELGIRVKIVPLSWEERQRRIQSREYDLALSGWFVDYADKTEFLERFVFRLGQNTTGWSNQEYDTMVNKAKVSISEEERLAALKQADNVLMIEMPVLPLYDYTRVFAVKEGIEGYYLPPAGVEIEFKWVSK